MVAEGKDFIVREAVIMEDELTEITTFAPKRKMSFHQIKSPPEGVIVNEILEDDAGELQLRLYGYLGLLGVTPGSEQERQAQAVLDSDDHGGRASLASHLGARPDARRGGEALIANLSLPGNGGRWFANWKLSVEPTAAADGGRDRGFSGFAVAQRGRRC